MRVRIDDESVFETRSGSTDENTEKKTAKAPANAAHPGEILREEFMRPFGLSAYRLAKELRVPAPRINDILLEKRGITADTALRLARYFGNSAQYWMNMQADYDLLLATANRKENC